MIPVACDPEKKSSKDPVGVASVIAEVGNKGGKGLREDLLTHVLGEAVWGFHRRGGPRSEGRKFARRGRVGGEKN